MRETDPPEPTGENLADIDPRNHEPDCTCVRVDVDLYDASYCDFCNDQSDWNRECRTWDRLERAGVDPIPELQPKPWGDQTITDADCPF